MSADKKKEGEGETAPKKKGGKGKMLIMLLGAVVLGGGGVGGGLYASGLIASGEPVEEGPEHPHLVPRDGVSASAIARGEQEAEHGRINPHIFQSTYHALPNNFTSNLAGGDSFVQMGLGVSTYYGEPVVESVTRHEMAIRSAVLMVLSQQNPQEVATPEGRERLRGVLKNAVNGVLTNREGFGGIDEVYFTSFVTQ